MTVFRETSEVEVGETGSKGCIYLRNSGHIRGMTTTASGKSTENSFRVVVLISGSFLIIRKSFWKVCTGTPRIQLE